MIEVDFPVGYDLSGVLGVVSGNTKRDSFGKRRDIDYYLRRANSRLHSGGYCGFRDQESAVVRLNWRYALRSKDSRVAPDDEGSVSPNTLISAALNCYPFDDGICRCRTTG